MNSTRKSRLLSRLVAATAGLFLCSLAASAQADFVFTQFSGSSTLNLVQNAAIAGNVLRLTPASTSQRGAAWYTTQQTVQNPFETSFRFQLNNVTPQPANGNGDGFAFVIQNDSPTAIGTLNAGGSGIGYHQLPNSVAVEFDTWPNSDTTIVDPNDNHISVHTRGTLPNDASETYSLGNTGTSLATNLSDGLAHDVLIRYAPGQLRVFVDGSSTAALTVPLDLATTLSLNSGQAYVGFTAATGGAFENHDILNWSFTAVPEPATALLLAICLSIVAGRRRPTL